MYTAPPKHTLKISLHSVRLEVSPNLNQNFAYSITKCKNRSRPIQMDLGVYLTKPNSSLPDSVVKLFKFQLLRDCLSFKNMLFVSSRRFYPANLTKLFSSFIPERHIFVAQWNLFIVNLIFVHRGYTRERDCKFWKYF